jgi:hypothetical protein
MVGWKRYFYSIIGWEYDERPSQETLNGRKELLKQIKKSNLKLNNVCEVKDNPQIIPTKTKIKKKKERKKRKKSIN